MRRQRRINEYVDDEETSTSLTILQLPSDDVFTLERLSYNGSKTKGHRFENTIEAKVEEGDTLQALALKFHCTVAEIKRINKIDKENEIHAHKVIKIPVTVHSILLSTSLPTVHNSGNNSPNRAVSTNKGTMNPLEDAILKEKLIVASVNAAGGMSDINTVILNSKVEASTNIYTNEVSTQIANEDSVSPLLLDDAFVSQPRPIRGPSLRAAIEWSGSDCDLSWVCLFVGIMAICFVIPLLYVIHLAEHPHHNTM